MQARRHFLDSFHERTSSSTERGGSVVEEEEASDRGRRKKLAGGDRVALTRILFLNIFPI
jgi:hypothetical protein